MLVQTGVGPVGGGGRRADGASPLACALGTARIYHRDDAHMA